MKDKVIELGATLLCLGLILLGVGACSPLFIFQVLVVIGLAMVIVGIIILGVAMQE